jgi:hypothetical protein
VRADVILNTRVGAATRVGVYETVLRDGLAKFSPVSELLGGLNLLAESGEPRSCWLWFELEDLGAAAGVVNVLTRVARVPRGSSISIDGGRPREFGLAEGVAVYLNATDLADEVYRNGDVRDLTREISDALGQLQWELLTWHGLRETAMYVYGESAAALINLMNPVLAANPLAESCRIVTVA